MKKTAIVIGVNNTERMPPLAGAVSGAKDFAAWAASQQFHVELHTDEHRDVTFDDVYASVDKVIGSRKCKTLVIFFAGHGRWKGVGTETWLLSKTSRPAQGIEVYPTSLLATGSGIPHVIFISDACRSVITDPVVINMAAQPLFPFMQSSVDTKIDLMFSCLPSEASYETKPGSDGSKVFGIYTNLVLNGLNGNVAEIKTALRPKNGVRKLVVDGNKLHEYLWKVLPEEVTKRDPNATQRPHSQIGSRLPKQYLAEFNDNTYTPDPIPTEKVLGEKLVHQPEFQAVRRSLLMLEDGLYERKSLEALLGTDPGFEPMEYYNFKQQTREITSKMAASPEQKGNLLIYESSDLPTSSGYSLHIARPHIPSEKDFVGGTSQLKSVIRHLDDGHTFIGTTDNRDQQLLLNLHDGRMVLIPMLKNFIGKLWMREEKVMHISFQPTARHDKYSGYFDQYEQIENRISLMISVAHTGANKLLLSTNAKELLADYLRRGKAFDPVLGLYAAYMYAQAGLKKDVISVYRYMLQEQEPILFDVQILAILLGARKSRPQDDEILRTGYPVLIQGWQHIPKEVMIFRPDLQQLYNQLVPGLWTTFKSEARLLLY